MLSTAPAIHRSVGWGKQQAHEVRVLSVIPGLAGGASMVFAKRQAQSLAGTGVNNHTFYLASRTSPLQMWRELRRFRRAIMQFQPDVVHAHFGTATAMFCALATWRPLVITFRGSDLNPCPSMPWLRARLGRMFSHLAAVRARCVICVSGQLRRRLWWRRRRVWVIPSGVDTNIFYPRPCDQARRELGWTGQQRVVLFNAGRSPAVKRLDLAQAAVEVARSEIANVRLIVLDGSTDPRQIPSLMNAADCLLLTSDWEGSPNVVKEAMACNLPVVTVDVGDVRERLCNVYPSIIAQRDPVAIGRALGQILTRPIRSNGSSAVTDVSLEAIARPLALVYEHAAARRGRHA